MKSNQDNSMQGMSPMRKWLRHLWLDADSVKRVLPKEALSRLEERVRLSETRHRGELRVCVEGGLGWQGWRYKVNAHERAISLFSQLRVWDTEHNNGVLIYLQLAERRIEILADRGLSNQVDTLAWQSMVDNLRAHFLHEDYENGLALAIDQVGEWMRKFYPLLEHHMDDVNELPNAVIIL